MSKPAYEKLPRELMHHVRDHREAATKQLHRELNRWHRIHRAAQNRPAPASLSAGYGVGLLTGLGLGALLAYMLVRVKQSTNQDEE